MASSDSNRHAGLRHLLAPVEFLARDHGQRDVAHFARQRHPAALRQRRERCHAKPGAGPQHDLDRGLLRRLAADLHDVVALEMGKRQGQRLEIIEQPELPGACAALRSDSRVKRQSRLVRATVSPSTGPCHGDGGGRQRRQPLRLHIGARSSLPARRNCRSSGRRRRGTRVEPGSTSPKRELVPPISPTSASSVMDFPPRLQLPRHGDLGNSEALPCPQNPSRKRLEPLQPSGFP